VQRAIIGTMSAPGATQNDPLIITSATDGSGVGTAVIAARTIERVKRGIWKTFVSGRHVSIKMI